MKNNEKIIVKSKKINNILTKIVFFLLCCANAQSASIISINIIDIPVNLPNKPGTCLLCATTLSKHTDIPRKDLDKLGIGNDLYGGWKISMNLINRNEMLQYFKKQIPVQQDGKYQLSYQLYYSKNSNYFVDGFDFMKESELNEEHQLTTNDGNGFLIKHKTNGSSQDLIPLLQKKIEQEKATASGIDAELSKIKQIIPGENGGNLVSVAPAISTIFLSTVNNDIRKIYIIKLSKSLFYTLGN